MGYVAIDVLESAEVVANLSQNGDSDGKLPETLRSGGEASISAIFP